MEMDRLKLDEFAVDFDDLLIDVDELQNPSDGPDGESLDRIASARESARDEAEDSDEFDVEPSDQ
jgi:hypothetical protein